MVSKIDNIIQVMRSCAITLGRNAFANKAGIWEASIREIHSDEWDPRLSTLKKLEQAIPEEEMKK